MPTIYPEEIVDDDEAEGLPRWSESNPGDDQKSFLYPTPPGPHRRYAARRTGQQAREVDRLAGNPSPAPRLTPRQWSAQWRCLDEEK